jgi:hypothetical protein
MQVEVVVGSKPAEPEARAASGVADMDHLVLGRQMAPLILGVEQVGVEAELVLADLVVRE